MTSPPDKRMHQLARAGLLLGRQKDPELKELGDLFFEWSRAGGAEPLDRVLGLCPAPGQRSRRTAARKAQRDILIKALAKAHYPGNSRAASQAMCRDWSRYASSGWSSDRKCEETPPHRIGKAEAWFWQIMRLDDHVPADRTIRKILAAS